MAACDMENELQNYTGFSMQSPSQPLNRVVTWRNRPRPFRQGFVYFLIDFSCRFCVRVDAPPDTPTLCGFRARLLPA